MDTNAAIELFKQACAADPDRRYSSIRTQFNRKAWQLDTREGVLKISEEKWYRIYFWPTIQYARDHDMIAPFYGILVKGEYDELKKLYFGEVLPDYRYLKQRFNIDKKDA